MSRIAYIDVDTQFDFMDPKGSLYVPGANDILPNITRLLKHAQQKAIPVVGSVDAHIENDPEFKVYPRHCVKGTPGQRKIPEATLESQKVIPLDKKADKTDLEPPGPVILEKNVYSLFDNPNADDALKATGAKKFVVFGVALDICVRAAALGLLERGYKVDIVRDATASVSDEKGKETLDALKKKGACVIDTAQALRLKT